tara:strand:- start:2280 stop:2396 length:117 start_codon:yes stop_codon:yes gene_type:complete
MRARKAKATGELGSDSDISRGMGTDKRRERTNPEATSQ